MATEAESDGHGAVDRRDFTKILFGSVCGVGALTVVWAFGEALEPGPGTSQPAAPKDKTMDQAMKRLR